MRQSTIKELDTPQLKAVLKKCVFSGLLNSLNDAYFNVVLGNLFQRLGAASPYFFNLLFGTTKSYFLHSLLPYPLECFSLCAVTTIRMPGTGYGCIPLTWAKRSVNSLGNRKQNSGKISSRNSRCPLTFSAGTAQRVVYHLL